MPSTTSRGAYPYPLGGDAPGTLGVNTAIQNLATQNASVNALYQQGTHSARPAAASSNQGMLYYETDTSEQWYSTGSAWERPAKRVNGATSFPTSPAEADETLILATSLRQRTYWRFWYDAAGVDAYKWIFIGGAPMWDDGTSGGAFTGDSAPHQPAPAGNYPAITLPFAGKFMIRWFAQAHPSSGTPTYLRASLLRNGTLYAYSETLANTSRTLTASGVFDSTESSSGVTFSVAVQSDAGSWTVDDWRVEATPVRVSP